MSSDTPPHTPVWSPPEAPITGAIAEAITGSLTDSGAAPVTAPAAGLAAAASADAAPPLLFRYAESAVPTEHGDVRVYVYRLWRHHGADPLEVVPAQDEHLALVTGAVAGASEVLCRVHSECWTGETMGSLKCDCRAQFDAALAAMGRAGRGVLVYLRQEGRGIGLGNKIRAYALQAAGADTVQANEALGFRADLRSYDLAAAILRDLGVESVELMTNNPDKLRALEQAGVRVARVPHWIKEGEHNRDYLAVKRDKLGHHT